MKKKNKRMRKKYPPNLFPIYSLPPLLRDAALEIIRLTGTSQAIACVAVLAAYNHAINSAYDVSQTGYTVSSIGEFFLTSAESVVGKGVAIGYAFKAHELFEAYVAEKYPKDKSAFAAAKVIWDLEEKEIYRKIKRALKNGEPVDAFHSELQQHLDKSITEPAVPRIIQQDATTESISRALTSSWPWVGLVSNDAFNLLMGRAFRNLTLMTTAWDGSTLHIDRADGTSLTHPAPRLSMCLMLQPDRLDEFDEVRGDEAESIGFISRVLFCESELQIPELVTADLSATSSPGLDLLTKTIFDVFKKTWTGVEQGTHKRQTVVFDIEARKLSADYFIKDIRPHCAPDGRFRGMRRFAFRFGQHLARLAGTFALADGERLIANINDVERAKTVMDYFMEEHRRYFAEEPSLPQDEEDAIALERWLLDHTTRYPQRGKTFSKRYCQQRVTPIALRNLQRFTDAMHVLQEQGKVQLRIDHRGSKVFDCLPALFNVDQPFSAQPLYPINIPDGSSYNGAFTYRTSGAL